MVLPDSHEGVQGDFRGISALNCINITWGSQPRQPEVRVRSSLIPVLSRQPTRTGQFEEPLVSQGSFSTRLFLTAHWDRYSKKYYTTALLLGIF